MKALLRAAAVLSFGFFFVGGLMILGLACLNGPHSDSAVVAAVGLFFIGTAFFVGPLSSPRPSGSDERLTENDHAPALRPAALDRSLLYWRRWQGPT
jgi:hypothetical protein